DLRARTKLSSAERFSLIRDLLYAAVLGVILLSFGFLFVRSRKVTPPRINLDRLAAQIEEEEAAKESARLAEAASQATLLNARLKTPQYSMDADFTLKGGKLESLLLTLTTPQPPEPSDVQLAEGKFAQAWLEKLVVDQMHLTHKPKAEFLASGNAKLFIKSHKGPERVVAKAVITGGYTAEPAVLTAKVLINRGFKELPKNTTFLFETLPNGDYRFFCSLSLNAR
ncbi:MAG: hypothetical protein GX589_04970, partial [Deltaproteobacteria bacterium]|nr:hypothetical protein [Deltaproteobacteria bacterium]